LCLEVSDWLHGELGALGTDAQLQKERKEVIGNNGRELRCTTTKNQESKGKEATEATQPSFHHQYDLTWRAACESQ